MTDESVSNTVRGLWQSQPTEPAKITPPELRQKMQKFERRISRRNLREYAASAFVVLIFGYYEWKFPSPLMRIGSGLIILAALYVARQLHRRGKAGSAQMDLALNPCLDFYRLELERQRDLLRSVWSWYLLPFVPGLAIFEFGIAVAISSSHQGPLAHLGPAVLTFSLSSAFIAAVFFFTWKINQAGAKKLQLQIDDLTSLQTDPH